MKQPIVLASGERQGSELFGVNTTRVCGLSWSWNPSQGCIVLKCVVLIVFYWRSRRRSWEPLQSKRLCCLSSKPSRKEERGESPITNDSLLWSWASCGAAGASLIHHRRIHFSPFFFVFIRRHLLFHTPNLTPQTPAGQFRNWDFLLVIDSVWGPGGSCGDAFQFDSLPHCFYLLFRPL